MTKEEEEEISRLEINVLRLVERLDSQRGVILELKKELLDSKKEIENLKYKNSQLEKKCLLTSAVVSMSCGEDTHNLESFLDDMIKKVDSCIEQIEAI